MLEEPSPETDPTFQITLDRKAAWTLQVAIRPGMPLLKTKHTQDMPVYRWQEYARALRRKVNNAILRFEDEEETKTVELSITEAEGWIIDQNTPFDGAGGIGGLLLIQVFRGMWNLSMGGLTPTTLVAEPVQEPAEGEEMLTEPENPTTSPDVKPDLTSWMQSWPPDEMPSA